MRTCRIPIHRHRGQESIKLALLLNAISPVIGGVLIRGHKGTANRRPCARSHACCRTSRWWQAAPLRVPCRTT